MRNVLFILSLAIMLILTSIGFSSIGKLLFTGESADYLVDLISFNKIISFVFILIFIILWYYQRLYPQKIKIQYLFIVFVLWIISGRTIAAVIYPDGKIITGWFCIGVESIYLCDHKKDCEIVITSETKIKKIPFWVLQIRNDSISQSIFVGPFIWAETLELFKSKGFQLE